MANGHTFGDLVSEGRGKIAAFSLAGMALASGMGWWASQEGRDTADRVRGELRIEMTALRADLRAEIAELEAEMRELVASAIGSNQDTSDMRMEAISDRFARLEMALQNNVGRTEFDYFVRETGRRLDGHAATLQWLRDGRSPRDNQVPR